MSYTPSQLAAMSGEATYKQAPTGGNYFDTITLAKDGKLYVSYYSQPKDERKDPDELATPVVGTIIKIRRTLIAFENGRPSLKSVEYDADADRILTTKGELTEKEAKDMGAKVQLVLYVLYNNQITKLQVSGGSLYNPNDEQDMRLYTYLQSFEEDDHSFMHETHIATKPNTYTDSEGFDKTSYQLTFKRGTKHDNLDAVGAAMERLNAELPECDERDKKFLNYTPKADTTAPVEYPAGTEDSDEPF